MYRTDGTVLFADDSVVLEFFTHDHAATHEHMKVALAVLEAHED